MKSLLALSPFPLKSTHGGNEQTEFLPVITAQCKLLSEGSSHRKVGRGIPPSCQRTWWAQSALLSWCVVSAFTKGALIRDRSVLCDFYPPRPSQQRAQWLPLYCGYSCLWSLLWDPGSPLIKQTYLKPPELTLCQKQTQKQ